MEKKFVVVDGEGRSAGNEGRRGQDVALPCINHNLTSWNMLQITHTYIFTFFETRFTQKEEVQN